MAVTETVLKSELMQLWRCRVQYLRQFYQYNDKKPKQRGYFGPSRHVWFIPLMLTAWLTGLSSIILLALNVGQMLDTVSLLWDLNVLLNLNLPLMVVWWRLALQQSAYHTQPRFLKRYDLFKSTYHSSRGGQRVPLTLMESPHKQRSDQKRSVKFKVHSRDHRRVIYLLLILAGDVETNPGPVLKVDTTPLDEDDFCDIHELLQNEEARCYEIGTRLKLRQSLLETIKKEATDYADALRKIITNWLRKNYNVKRFGPPTWKALVEAVQAPGGGNNTALAEEIARQHPAEGQEQVDTTDSTAQPEQQQQPQADSEATDTLPTDADMSCQRLAVDLALFFPELPAGSKLSEAELSLLMEGLYDDTKKVQSEFARLMFKLQKHLEKTVEMEDVVSFLVFQDKQFMTVLSDCTRLSQVFMKMINFISFFDYDLLELLVEEFGSTDIEERFKKFEASFEAFSKRRVCECPANAFGDPEESEKVWVLKTDKIIGNLTVEDLKRFNYQVNKILGNKLTRVLRVEKGCVKVTYRSLEDEAYVLTEEQWQALQRIGVKSITYGGQTIDTAPSTKNSLRSSSSTTAQQKSEVMKHSQTKFSEEVFEIQGYFTELCLKFTENFSRNEINFDQLYLESERLYHLTTDDPSCQERDVNKLWLYICEKQSYLNFSKLSTIVRNIGSEGDKKRLCAYGKAFAKHLQNRVYNCPELCQKLQDHFTASFVISTDRQQYILKDAFDFKNRVGNYFGVSSEQILVSAVRVGSLHINLQFPCTSLSDLTFASLHPTKVRALKNEELTIQKLKFEDHELILENWNVLTDVEIGENILCEQRSGIKTADCSGQACMALEYASLTPEIGFVKYLENVLNREHKDMPAIKGLYYPQPATEGQAFQYPLLITEAYDLMENSVTKPMEEVDQVSFLLDIANCIKDFKKFNRAVKIAVHPKAIFVTNKDGVLKAKLCPLYGYSYTSEQSQELALSLPLDELSWMKKVAEYLEFGDGDDHKLPEEHLLKKLFEQKWLSEDDCFRPSNFNVLCDDLHHLLETEKIWLGLIASNPEDSEDGELQIHLILIGHTGVGKTSIRKHLKNEPIDMKESPTIVMEPEFLYRESMETVSPFKRITDMSCSDKKNVFLTMWDTGGQPIFQDLLPCFARLNCMYGVVFRLTDIEDFDSKPEIRPCDEYHQKAISPFTKKDIFYRDLAYVQAFSFSMQEKLKDLPMFEEPAPLDVNSPAAVVVGTCKDELESSGSTLTDFQDSKKQVYKEMKDFISHNNISVYYGPQDDSDYILEVDNTVSGTRKVDPGIEQLKRNIYQCSQDSKIRIKPQWQKFKLALQRMCYRQDQYLNHGIIPLKEAIAVGEECEVSNPKSALKCFHELGVFMWYHLSKRQSMNSFVVIDQKTILDVLSKVFCFNPASVPSEMKLLMSKGVLTINFFQQLLRSKASKINDEWFMAFLEEHNLSVKINLCSGRETGYFVPSILCTTSDYEQNLLKIGDKASGTSPLYIVPLSGYIPTGMFTRLLTALAGVTYGSTIWRIPLEGGFLGDVCRNQFEFIVNGNIYVILSEFSKYIRVDAIPFRDELMEDLLYRIVTTLDVQLQRSVPRWLEKREFKFTFACEKSTCCDSPLHFYDDVDVPVKSNREVTCSMDRNSTLELPQMIWHQSKPTFNKREATMQFQKSMKDGYLNITIASVIFVGVQSSLVANAEHIVFQEPVTATSKLPLLVNHEIYFRAEGNSTLQKIQPFNYDDIILYSLSFGTPEFMPRISPPSNESVTVKSVQSGNLSTETSSSSSSQDQISDRTPDQISDHTPELPASQLDSSQRDSFQHISSQPASSSDQHTSSSEEDEVLKEFGLPEFDRSQFLRESANIEGFIKYMMQYNTTGKMELFHVFNFSSDFRMSEILKIFIKNVSLCVLVTDSSEELSERELSILHSNKNFADQGLVIGSFSGSDSPSRSRNAQLDQFSDFLKTDANQPQKYVFSMNCQEPDGNDDKTGASIVSHALSSATPETFPLSWYYFGFKLQEIMMSNNLNTVSVSKECMIIAEQLKMDRPTVIAALEHLTENNMLLYFRDVLEDTVFAGVHVFSTIFSEISKDSTFKHSAIISEASLTKATKYFTSEHISSKDFIAMFTKLMILAPYKGAYLVPSQLQLLAEMEQKNASNFETAYIKCPSSGYEYICMLSVFFLTKPLKWKLVNEALLHKNCIKLSYVSDYEVIVTVSFNMGYIELYIQVEDPYYNPVPKLCNSILQGLEKIKLILNVEHHQSFNFVSHFVATVVLWTEYTTLPIMSDREN